MIWISSLLYAKVVLQVTCTLLYIYIHIYIHYWTLGPSLVSSDQLCGSNDVRARPKYQETTGPTLRTDWRQPLKGSISYRWQCLRCGSPVGHQCGHCFVCSSVRDRKVETISIRLKDIEAKQGSEWKYQIPQTSKVSHFVAFGRQCGTRYNTLLKGHAQCGQTFKAEQAKKQITKWALTILYDTRRESMAFRLAKPWMCKPMEWRLTHCQTNSFDYQHMSLNFYHSFTWLTWPRFGFVKQRVALWTIYTAIIRNPYICFALEDPRPSMQLQVFQSLLHRGLKCGARRFMLIVFVCNVHVRYIRVMSPWKVVADVGELLSGLFIVGWKIGAMVKMFEDQFLQGGMRVENGWIYRNMHGRL